MTSSRCALALVLSVSALAFGCSDPPTAPAVDAGRDATLTPECDAVRSCDDDVRCNGVETCISGRCQPGRPPCRDGQLCDESTAACFTECAVTEDADGDGTRASECGGTDCDDSDAARFPGNDEVCDVQKHDEDCDPSTYGFRDSDEDGSPDALCCNVDPTGGGELCGRDCDDTAPGVNPSVPEVCNGIDDDCDAMIDEGLIVRLTVDSDEDGHGSSAVGAATMDACRGMAGWAELNDDCADDDPARYPGLPELCDVAAVDEDCSGTGNDVPGGCACTGTASEVCGTAGPCAGATRACVGGTWGPCAVVPRTEVCIDGERVDEDCDGMIDEALTVPCYRDNDEDGFAADGAVRTDSCRSAAISRMGPPWNSCPVGFTGRAPSVAADCCDSDARAFPFATEFQGTPRSCGGYDFDCDGVILPSRPDGLAMCVAATGCETTPAARGWCGAAPPACGENGTYLADCGVIRGACVVASCLVVYKACR